MNKEKYLVTFKELECYLIHAYTLGFQTGNNPYNPPSKMEENLDMLLNAAKKDFSNKIYYNECK